MPIQVIHARIGTAALIFMIIAGVWGIIRWRRNQTIDSNYFGILVIGEILVLAQMLMGVVMWLLMGRAPEVDRPWLHYLYGFVTALALPAVYTFAGQRTEEPRDQALYGFVCLFVAALVFRAMMTA